MAPNVFVLGAGKDLPQELQRVSFLLQRIVAGSAVRRFRSRAWISTGLSLPCDSTSFPFTFRQARGDGFIRYSSPKLGYIYDYLYVIYVVPSFNATKLTFFISRRVRTHPFTFTSVPVCADFNAIGNRCSLQLFHITPDSPVSLPDSREYNLNIRFTDICPPSGGSACWRPGTNQKLPFSTCSPLFPTGNAIFRATGFSLSARQSTLGRASAPGNPVSQKYGVRRGFFPSGSRYLPGSGLPS